jgi:hypothetical protein
MSAVADDINIKSNHIMKNIEIITEALKPIRDMIRDAAIKSMTHRLDSMTKKIEEADFDLKIAAPFPMGSRCSRQQYIQGKEQYDYARSITVRDEERSPCCPSMFAPNFVHMKDRAELEASNARAAEKHADESLISYAHKLAAKIVEKVGDKNVIDCAYHGATNPWVASQIVFTFDDATSATFTTSMILNCSCLGKLFNQFPTRLKK